MKTLEHFQAVQLPTSLLKSISGGFTMNTCQTETGNPLTDCCIDTTSTTSDDKGKVISTGTAVCCQQ